MAAIQSVAFKCLAPTKIARAVFSHSHSSCFGRKGLIRLEVPALRRCLAVSSRQPEQHLTTADGNRNISSGGVNQSTIATETAAIPLQAGLYVVATPIGCLEDITLRALRILRSADKILAEDTRRTSILLQHYGIKAHLESYHLHNEHGKISKVVNELRGGAALALVSDAGMPAINDPGAQLIAAAIEEGVAVIPVPGPSATLSALIGSGLPTSSFTFCGFCEAKSSARVKQFTKWRGLDSTLLFFVSPHALLGALEDACVVFGPSRRCCLARELTKAHEEFWRSTLSEALQEFRERGPRGEFTLVIDGGGAEPAEEASDEAVLGALRTAVTDGCSPSQAAKQVAIELGVPKKRAYNLSLSLKDVC